MLPRMNPLETAAHHADPGAALVVGLIALGGLMAMLGITLLFGSSRPHTSSK